MHLTNRYLGDAIYHTEHELEEHEKLAYPYKEHIAQKIVTLAHELAQLQFTRYILRQYYSLDLYMELKPEARAEIIRERLAAGEKASDLAKEYGISESAVSRYKHGNRKKERKE
jgi:Mor family transcriptional regulator